MHSSTITESPRLRRCGSSLVELLITMAIILIVLSLVLTCLGKVYKAANALRGEPLPATLTS